MKVLPDAGWRRWQACVKLHVVRGATLKSWQTFSLLHSVAPARGPNTVIESKPGLNIFHRGSSNK